MFQLINKIITKISSDGPSGLVKAILVKIYFKFLKNKFKIKSFIFFVKYNKSKIINNIKLGENNPGVKKLDINSICLSNQFTNDEIEKKLNKIKENKFTILHKDELSFSVKEDSKKIIWNADLVENVFWSNKIWGVDIPYKINNGDIKRPWELGRLHILVEIAFLYQSTKSQPLQKLLLIEFERIINDFSSSNPFFMGPQWMCAMDVAIRLCNIILSLQMLPNEVKYKYENLIYYEVNRHIFFIVNNIENGFGKISNNHYLANLAGLIIGELSFNKINNKKIDKLISHLEDEIQKQFLADGSCFEGSTMYHRLSLELVLFPLLFVLQKFPNYRFRQSTLEKIKSALFFSHSITDFEGQVIQIGDNDSGHLFLFNMDEYIKNDIEHISIQNAIFSFVKQYESSNSFHFTDVINSFLKKDLIFDFSSIISFSNIKFNSIKNIENSFDRVKMNDTDFNKLNSIESIDAHLETTITKHNNIYLKYDIIDKSLDFSKADFYVFAEFGLYIIKSSNFILSIRSGHSKSDANRGHEHFDQLSINLKTKSGIKILDAGTALYTSNSRIRNLYRGPLIHQVPFTQNLVESFEKTNIFSMPHLNGHCLYFKNNGFVGKYNYDAIEFQRCILFENGKIRIYDFTNSTKEPLFKLDFKFEKYSTRYGCFD